MDLGEIARAIRGSEGIVRKRGLGDVVRGLGSLERSGADWTGLDDDAAALRHGDRFLLLAADGIQEKLVTADPYRAGRAAVLVNVNDIYAMGGRPLAMVNVIGLPEGPRLDAVVRGLREESRRLRVPVVGGHLLPEPGGASLAAAILGEADRLLPGGGAGPGDALLLAVDLDGESWDLGFENWDSHCRKDPDRLIGDLDVLRTLAEEGLATAARDLSNAGILGSIATLLELSRVGARIDLEAIETPPGREMTPWLQTFPSYGFVIACTGAQVRHCLERFRARSIWAAQVGLVTAAPNMVIKHGGEETILFDFGRETITGL